MLCVVCLYEEDSSGFVEYFARLQKGEMTTDQVISEDLFNVLEGIFETPLCEDP